MFNRFASILSAMLAYLAWRMAGGSCAACRARRLVSPFTPYTRKRVYRVAQQPFMQA